MTSPAVNINGVVAQIKDATKLPLPPAKEKRLQEIMVQSGEGRELPIAVRSELEGLRMEQCNMPVRQNAVQKLNETTLYNRVWQFDIVGCEIKATPKRG